MAFNADNIYATFAWFFIPFREVSVKMAFDTE